MFRVFISFELSFEFSWFSGKKFHSNFIRKKNHENISFELNSIEILEKKFHSNLWLFRRNNSMEKIIRMKNCHQKFTGWAFFCEFSCSCPKNSRTLQLFFVAKKVFSKNFSKKKSSNLHRLGLQLKRSLFFHNFHRNKSCGTLQMKIP